MGPAECDFDMQLGCYVIYNASLASMCTIPHSSSFHPRTFSVALSLPLPCSAWQLAQIPVWFDVLVAISAPRLLPLVKHFAKAPQAPEILRHKMFHEWHWKPVIGLSSSFAQMLIHLSQGLTSIHHLITSGIYPPIGTLCNINHHPICVALTCVLSAKRTACKSAFPFEAATFHTLQHYVSSILCIVVFCFFTERGICLPTVSLWLLFVYIEASMRLREFKTMPIHLDLCRPFAAHWWVCFSFIKYITWS